MADDLDSVLQLANLYGDVSDAIIGIATAQQKAGTITMVEFNQAFQDGMAIRQRGVDMFASASHQLARTIASDADIAALTTATTGLKSQLIKLQTTETAIAVALKVLTALGTVAAAIVDPTHVTAGAALGAVAAAAQGIASAVQPSQSSTGSGT